MIKVLERMFDILEILDNEKQSSVTDIAKKIGVNKSTVSRILATLEKKNLVEKDHFSKKYKLGIGFVQYSNSVLNHIEITEVAKPFLTELVNITQESTHLGILLKGKAVFISQKKSSEIITVSTEIGGEEPVYCSAVGKCLIAFLPETQLDEILANLEFKAFTPRTIISPQILLANLKSIRELGYAIDDEEIYPGVRCIAAPVRNYKGKVIASIGISGPASRIVLGDIGKYAGYVKNVSEKLSEKLGYQS